MRFCYADPPYIGRAKRYYGDQPTFAGEVDHVELIASLKASNYDGWALSCAVDIPSLRIVLNELPDDARLCPWVKPGSAPKATNGIHNMWEGLIVVGGRQEPPGKCDWLRAQPARFGGDLPGRKPIAFIAWLWSLLGARSGDTLEDRFPGTGIVGKAWDHLSQAALGDVSADGFSDAQPRGLDDTSGQYFGDMFETGVDDASYPAPSDA
jgi:hypothetical protein